MQWLNRLRPVRALGAGEAHGDPWFMMEFVAGLPLNEYLESGRWNKPAAGEKTPGYCKTAPGLAELWRRAAHLAALPPALHSALRAAAFIGVEFHCNWWMEIAAREEDELHAAAGEAIRSGLLADAGRGRLRFQNEEVRALLEKETPETRRARLHARVLAVLEAGAQDADWELPLRVRHALGSGESGAALRHGHRLARRHLDNGQTSAAAPLLEKLGAVLNSEANAAGEVSAARRLTQRVLEAALSAIGNEHRKTAALCRDALGLARQLRRPAEERELQRRLSYALNGLGAYPSALAAAERALKLAEKAGDERDQVRAMLQRAIALRNQRKERAAMPVWRMPACAPQRRMMTPWAG